MKKPFNLRGHETYESRMEDLQAHAEKIDEFLQKPPQPGQFFQPKGPLRPQSHSFVHDALIQKRVDINQELETIKAEMAQRHEYEKAKSTEYTKGKAF